MKTVFCFWKMKHRLTARRNPFRRAPAAGWRQHWGRGRSKAGDPGLEQAALEKLPAKALIPANCILPHSPHHMPLPSVLNLPLFKEKQKQKQKNRAHIHWITKPPPQGPASIPSTNCPVHLMPQVPLMPLPWLLGFQTQYCPYCTVFPHKHNSIPHTTG